MVAVERVVSETTREATAMPIGQLLVRAGKLREGDIKQIVALQRQRALRFGDAALTLGLVNEADVENALARQFEYAYVRGGESRLSPALIAAYQPFGPQAESLRALRTQLMLRWFRDRNKTLAIVAARAEDGSSAIAANLAIVFAQLGERTLVMDANFRQPSQHELFGIGTAEGLSSLCAGRGSFKGAPAAVAHFKELSVLCAGPLPPNPQELLGRVGFAYIMETAPAAFDAVIIDAPPVLECADSLLVAARAGACLIVARRHHTRVADVQRTKELLGTTGSVLLGTVICE